ncbi:hypothetical protein L1887_23811 [Cichorium endivia]|nr:hypothetical protein L1887_23811 [Cichorium endivia]
MDRGLEDFLPKAEFLVVFNGVQGVDEREGNNPSWFNRIEASEVVEVIMDLIERGVSGHDIGVITPYRQQVVKISKALETFVGSEIKVGTVESFQGQEREGIICAGLAYYIHGLIMKDRGSVFVTAFSPLSMIIVAIMGSIIQSKD